MSYDQWKTATPYDDEIDIIELAEKWLERNSALETIPQSSTQDNRSGDIGSTLAETYALIKELTNYINENV
jgi:hypothetical protein